MTELVRGCAETTINYSLKCGGMWDIVEIMIRLA